MVLFIFFIIGHYLKLWEVMTFLNYSSNDTGWNSVINRFHDMKFMYNNFVIWEDISGTWAVWIISSFFLILRTNFATFELTVTRQWWNSFSKTILGKVSVWKYWNDEFFFQGSKRGAPSRPPQTRYSPKLFLRA